MGHKFRIHARVILETKLYLNSKPVAILVTQISYKKVEMTHPQSKLAPTRVINVLSNHFLVLTMDSVIEGCIYIKTREPLPIKEPP